ncbi:hypothetical protein GCM10027514_07460 [Azotobacter armeniacus]
MGAMSAGLFLAIRPMSLESFLGAQDKGLPPTQVAGPRRGRGLIGERLRQRMPDWRTAGGGLPQKLFETR